MAADVDTPIFRASNHSNENESPNCISPPPGFGPQSFAEPCDWPRAENVRFSGPYAVGVTHEEPHTRMRQNRTVCGNHHALDKLSLLPPGLRHERLHARISRQIDYHHAAT